MGAFLGAVVGYEFEDLQFAEGVEAVWPGSWVPRLASSRAEASVK